jgi:hypothetical protein
MLAAIDARSGDRDAITMDLMQTIRTLVRREHFTLSTQQQRILAHKFQSLNGAAEGQVTDSPEQERLTMQ